MRPYAEPSSAPPTHRPVVSDQVVDASGSKSFKVTFLAGQELPQHRNASRILISVLEGSGRITVDHGEPMAVVAGGLVQIDPNALHAVSAGLDGMVIEVHLVGDCCSSC